MPLIVYAGHTPLVDVPAHNLAEVEHGKPTDVPEHVAVDLTLDGASTVWRYATDDEIAAHLAAQLEVEPGAGGVDDESTEV